MAAVARDFGCVLVLLAIGAAVLLICHAATGRVGAFLLIGHGDLLGGMLPLLKLDAVRQPAAELSLIYCVQAGTRGGASP